jgi:stage II sporulation protein AA (anti-sigma F factor antagonist)
MVVCDVTPPVYRLFELSGLFKIVSIQENERTAVSSLEVAL